MATTRQQQTALDYANEIRLQRTLTLNEIRLIPEAESARRAALILRERRVELGSMTAFAYLLEIRRFGRIRALKTLSLHHIAISETMRMRELTDRQVEALAMRLDQC